jgi:1,4-dihydroxy-2-naphthoyl-CoA synthase
VSREFGKLSSEAMALGADEAVGLINDAWAEQLYAGENSKEGWRAFVEKRTPVWVDSKL